MPSRKSAVPPVEGGATAPPAHPPDVDELRSERRNRAIEEPLDVRPRNDGPVIELEVRNPIHHTRYLIVLPSYPEREGAMCTCNDFARRSIGTCKHLEAAWLWFADHPEPLFPATDPPGERSWGEIDRRLALDQQTRNLDPRTVRSAGKVLFEDGPLDV